MANPYALSPCGHSFCAICLLKWFFSRMHKKCGLWHQSVHCPICRNGIVLTPPRTPRPETTFPFTPNRAAAAVIEQQLEKLKTLSKTAKAKGKSRKHVDVISEMEQRLLGIKMKRGELQARRTMLGRGRGRKKTGCSRELDRQLRLLEKTDTEWTEVVQEITRDSGANHSFLQDWKQGGSAREDWLKRLQ